MCCVVDGGGVDEGCVWCKGQPPGRTRGSSAGASDVYKRRVVGRSEKKGRVAFQERRVLRLEVVFWKTRMRMTSRHTTTTTRAVKGKGRMKKDEGWG